MDKEKAKEYLSYLNEKYTEWYSYPKQRTKIAAEIYETAMLWDDEIYNYLSPGNATGLFERGFFETDIQRAFEKLKAIVNEGKPEPVNKLFKLYTVLQNYQAPQGEVVRKDLRDYLLEKIYHGELQGNKVTFRDDEDFAYFRKLTETIGIDVNNVLEDIVFNAFPQNI